MVGTMTGSKTCKRCGKKIREKKDKWVLLGTYNGKKTLEEIYFHFRCYLDWFNESLNIKAQQIIKKSIPIAFKKNMEKIGDMAGINA